MVDPEDVTNFQRTRAELFEFWLFSLFVRGKTASVQARKLDAFFASLGGMPGILDLDRSEIERGLRDVKAGQYGSLADAIHATNQALREDPAFLETADPEHLTALPGVGPKTARFFILHSRKESRFAALDTHIIKFLKLRGHLPESASNVTPGSERVYARLEAAFLEEADKEGVHPADFDLAIWKGARDGDIAGWRRYMPGAAAA